MTKVEISGADGAALRAAEAAVALAANTNVTRSDIIASRNAIIETGLFCAVEPVPKQTRDGVEIEFKLRQNAPLKALRVSGGKTLPKGIVDDILSAGEGKTCSQHQLLEVRGLACSAMLLCARCVSMSLCS